MSTRDDATLSAEERAAFARIEAQAIADDPSLGATLPFRLRQRMRGVVATVSREARRRWVGPLLVVVGVVLVVVGLVTTIAVSAVGIVIVVLGGIPVIEALRTRLQLATLWAAETRRPPPDPTR
ncbi:MAG: DUF3040 domain-containing protein [Actinomycetota bacterium]|nr:DUF3040 domain-containing protein [Actinomycetota bacterium]